ncbi:hypothetical protein BVRB_3g059530 [Beta vulgaris subsp. vulgaris]|nr:hypothetical protein BVRB_3g059530 [Beta vulgaris subsp. vulgaris]
MVAVRVGEGGQFAEERLKYLVLVGAYRGLIMLIGGGRCLEEFLQILRLKQLLCCRLRKPLVHDQCMR